MKAAEVEAMNSILDKYQMNLITVEWILRINDNPGCTIAEIAKNNLDANNIRVGLRSRSLADFVTTTPGKSSGIGRPAFTLNLNERGKNICKDLSDIISRLK